MTFVLDVAGIAEMPMSWHSSFIHSTDSRHNGIMFFCSCVIRLVSPGAATDGVTLFFLQKTWRPFFSHRPLESGDLDLFSCRLLTTAIFPRCLSSVLFKCSHKKLILFRCHLLDGVTRAVRPPLYPQ